MPALRIALLGGVRVQDDHGELDIGPAKCQAVLAALAIESVAAGEPCDVEVTDGARLTKRSHAAAYAGSDSMASFCWNLLACGTEANIYTYMY